MDTLLPSGNIFRELQDIHDTGYFSAQPSLEDHWQQGQRQEGSQVYVRCVPPFIHSVTTDRVWSKSVAAAPFSSVYGIRSWLVTFDLPVAAGIKCSLVSEYTKNRNCRTRSARKIRYVAMETVDNEYDPRV
ncbi:hypothetical protein P5V15_006736 [Pogonomyrmex californicus]